MKAASGKDSRAQETVHIDWGKLGKLILPLYG